LGPGYQLTTQNWQLTTAAKQLAYDDFGNLRHVALPDGRSIDYLIDATQRRVGRVLKDASDQVIDERRWLYQSGLRPVAELDGNNQVQTFFVYADKPNVPEYMERGGQKYRIITDHLGSLRLVAHTATGEIKQRMLHDEHGNVIEDYIASGWDPLPFGFAGGIYDRDTGLVRFGARDFDPEIARWTAQDPIGFGGGDGNLSAYVGNDPVNFVDPSGLDRVRVEGELPPGYQRVILDAAGAATGFGGGMETALRFQNRPTRTGQVRFGRGNPGGRYGWNRTFHLDGPHGRVRTPHFNAEVGPLSRFNHAPISQSVYRLGSEHVLRTAGRAALAAGIAMDSYAIATAPDGQRAQAVCSAAAGWGGAAVGGAAGSYLWPGPGTIVGALIGGLTGSEVAQDVECGR
jgi:RHS repeat-associated protein